MSSKAPLRIEYGVLLVDTNGERSEGARVTTLVCKPVAQLFSGAGAFIRTIRAGGAADAGDVGRRIAREESH